MSDLIDRQALLKTLNENKIEFNSDINYFILSAPSANQWIPCSERLPEEYQIVLTTIIGTDIIHQREGETLVDAIEMARKMKIVSVGFLGSDGWYGADGYPEIVTPRAWMPLPEPWKGEEECT